MNLNKVMLAGNLTRSPEIKTVGLSQQPGGQHNRVCKFGIAINKRRRDKDDEVTFIDCEAWNRTAELIHEYVKKGDPLFIEGRLQLDQWESQSGEKRSKLKVVADSIQFLKGKAYEG